MRPSISLRRPKISDSFGRRDCLGRLVGRALCVAAISIAVASPVREADAANFGIKFFDPATEPWYRDPIAAWFQTRKPLTRFPRTEIFVPGDPLPSSIENCEHLVALSAISDRVDELRDLRWFQYDYINCFALSALNYAQPARISYFDHSDLGADFYANLTLEGVQGGYRTTLQSVPVEQRLASITRSSATVEDYNNWYTELVAVAAADFDGDGIEDILVQFLDQGLGSAHYLNRVILVVSRKEPNGPLTYTLPELRPLPLHMQPPPAP